MSGKSRYNQVTGEEMWIRGAGSPLRMHDVMTTDFPVLRSEDTLRTAVTMMRSARVDGIPVLDDNDSLAGLLTRSTVYEAILQGYPLESSVKPWMIGTVVTVHPLEPFSLVVEIVKQSPVGMGVVVDDSSKVVGLFTKADMIMALFQEADLLSARLHAIYEAIPDGMVAVDAAGKLLLFNRAAQRLLHVDEDVLGMPSAELFPALDLEGVLAEGMPLLRKQTSHKSRSLLVNATPILEGDAVVGAIASVHDLTDVEKVAAELEVVKRIQHTLETVLNIAYDGIIVINEHGKVTLINRALADFLGVRSDEVIGRHVSKVLENSRLQVVARTGVAEMSDVQEIKGVQYIVTRLPILEGEKVVGAVGKITFRRLKEFKELARRLESLENQVAYYREEMHRAEGGRKGIETIVSCSMAMKKCKEDALVAAGSISTVLLRGESGTGKELFAQAIHVHSHRHRRPLVKINCAAIPETLLESELFGYADGAFTGARKGGKPGRLELANGGTLFLDEIGDMPLVLQAKLLRVLQEKEFEQVGGTEPVRIDVRIIAATNQDLEKAVEAGKFRADLYYRLNVISVEIPPLRSRKEDMLPLAEFFVGKYNRILGANVDGLTKEALDALYRHHWPGNVRELENVIERAINFAMSGMIRLKHLPPYVFEKYGENPDAVVRGRDLQSRLLEAEKEALLQALDAAGGNKSEAARLLGISRSRLYEKLHKAGL